ncbi:MAG: hypothetical protein ABW140_17965, partial [Candidatus Sedimenticola sp. 6PFRAG1]
RVIRIDDTTIQLEEIAGGLTNLVNAPTGAGYSLQLVSRQVDFLTSSVDYTNDTLGFAAPHGFATGDAIVYHNTVDAIGGLAEDQVYYVITTADDSVLKLAASASDAADGTAVDLTPATREQPFFSRYESRSFDVSTIEDGSDTIVFGEAHGFLQGEEVVYTGIAGSTVTGLVAGQTYYVILVDANRLRLATTEQNATAGTAVAIAPLVDSVDHVLTRHMELAFDATATGGKVDVAADTITFASAHRLNDGDILFYTARGEDSLSGLRDGQVYRVQVESDNSISLQGVDLAYASGSSDGRYLETYGGSINVSAEDDSELGTVSVGVGGGLIVGIAGSVGVNVVVKDTQAYISGTTAIAANDISLAASDDALEWAVAGAVPLSLIASVGAAVAVTVDVGDVFAFVDDSSVLDAGRNIELSA